MQQTQHYWSRCRAPPSPRCWDQCEHWATQEEQHGSEQLELRAPQEEKGAGPCPGCDHCQAPCADATAAHTLVTGPHPTTLLATVAHRVRGAMRGGMRRDGAKRAKARMRQHHKRQRCGARRRRIPWSRVPTQRARSHAARKTRRRLGSEKSVPSALEGGFTGPIAIPAGLAIISDFCKYCPGGLAIIMALLARHVGWPSQKVAVKAL